MTQRGASTIGRSISERIIQFCTSNVFFGLTIALLIIQSAWIALTARYPQAFDEQVHFGLIQLHAHQWTPFFDHQPPGANAYGAIVRDPSYLYHYLLSFPYRLIAFLTHSETIQVISLRFINIALFTWGLVVFRRLLKTANFSPLLTHIACFLVVITPVIPMLAGQINYDNLIIPLAGLLMLSCLRLQALAKQRQPISWRPIFTISILAIIGSLVKYAFLPFAFVAICYVLYTYAKNRPRLRLALRCSWRTIFASLLVVLAIGLFSERYGVNLVRYHEPVPECDQVLSVKDCQAYSPWVRNYQLASHYGHPHTAQIIDYPRQWVSRAVEESLFAIGSGFNNGADFTKNNYGLVDYWQARSLPIAKIIFYAFLITGLLSIGIFFRQIFKPPAVRLLALFSVVYVLILFLQNLSDFLRIGTITAVHGRYLAPIIVFLYAVLLSGLVASWRRLHLARQVSQTLAVWLTVALIGVFVLQGGGMTTYFVRSETRWFWPQSTLARHANKTMHDIFKPIVLGSNKY